MVIQEILNKVRIEKYIIISDDELTNLLKEAKLLEEKDTHISDMIRIFKVDEMFAIQEKSNKNELVLRLMPNRKAAEKFISDRLETYERMWDGCGCKVDYYK